MMRFLLTMTLATTLFVPFAVPASAQLGSQEGSTIAESIDSGGVTTADERRAILPSLQVQIPGLSADEFNQSVVVGLGRKINGCPENTVCVRTLTVYLNAVYRYAAGMAVVFAILLIMSGGIQWMIGSSVGGTAKAQERMKNASLGLLFVFSAHLILTFINPDITSLSQIQLTVVEGIPEPSAEYLSDVGEGIQRGNIKAVLTGTGTYAGAKTSEYINGRVTVSEDIITDLTLAAIELKRVTGKKMSIAGGIRTSQRQVELFYQNCLQGGKTSCSPLTCNPFDQKDPNKPVEKTGSNQYKLVGSYASMSDAELLPALIDFVLNEQKTVTCPHNTGATVDVWCEPGGNHSTKDPECMYQLELAMQKYNFCRIYQEGWHFEHKVALLSGSAKACDWVPGTVLISGSRCASSDDVAREIGDGADINYSSTDSDQCTFPYYERCQAGVLGSLEEAYDSFGDLFANTGAAGPAIGANLKTGDCFEND